MCHTRSFDGDGPARPATSPGPCPPGGFADTDAALALEAISRDAEAEAALAVAAGLPLEEMPLRLLCQYAAAARALDLDRLAAALEAEVGRRIRATTIGA